VQAADKGHHREALEVYLSLGEARTYRQVAERIGVSVASIKRWAKAGNWTEKAGEHDAEVARKIADRTLGSVMEDTDRLIALVRAALARLAQGVKSGNIKMQLGDLERLIRLYAQLSGHPDGQLGPTTHGAQTVEELRAYVNMTGTSVLQKYQALCEQENEQHRLEREEQERRRREWQREAADQSAEDAEAAK
jgi:hypothetical protein